MLAALELVETLGLDLWVGPAVDDFPKGALVFGSAAMSSDPASSVGVGIVVVAVFSKEGLDSAIV